MRDLITALRCALGQVLGRPRLVLAVYLVNLVLALPLGLAMTQVLAPSLGDGRFQEDARARFDAEWWIELRADHAGDAGLGSTFRPVRVLGPGPILDNLDAFLQGDAWWRAPSLFGVLLVWALAWVALQGAVLDRFVRPERPSGPASFGAAAGRHLPALLPLAAVGAGLAWIVYEVAARAVQRIDAASFDVNRETAMLWRLAPVVLAMLALLFLVRLVIDLAKASAVATGVPAMMSLVCLGDALRALARRPLLVLAAYGAGGLLILLWLGLGLWLAPEGAASTWPVALAVFLGGQLFIAGRLALRLVQLAVAAQVHGMAREPRAARARGRQ